MSQKKSFLTFGAIIVIVALLIGARQLGLLRSVNEALAGIFAPVARIGYWFGDIFQGDSNNDRPTVELQEELEKIKAENRRLLVENALLVTTEQENSDLRKYLQFFKSESRDFILASVIAREKSGDDSRQQTIILDRGSHDGLIVGQPIVDTEGVLLGKIISVQDQISEGCLLFKDSCRIAVGIQGQTGTIGVLQSDVALSIKVDFIPHSRTINEQDLVVTSGLEAGMPAGLVLGRVNRVIKEGNELWQHALIEPLGNFEHMRVVAIIK